MPDLDSGRDEWSELAERAGNLFGTWEWATAWWRVYGDGQPLLTTICRDGGGRAVAILPLYLAMRRPVRVIRFVGHGAADQLGPVCAPEDRGAAAEGLRALLAERASRWDVLLAERLAPLDGWRELLGARVLHTEESPTLKIEGRSFDEFLASRSRNFREQVRRRRRKLERHRGPSFRLADSESLGADLETLFRLHDARFADGESSAFTGPRREFHRHFARAALDRGWLRLWTLELDGEPAASWYGFRFAGADWYYQSGRDPRFDRDSVGFVLLSHTIEQAFDAGMSEYRLLRGGEEYKGRFASEDPGLETVALARGPRGRVAVRAVLAARSAPGGLRRRLRRLDQ